MSINGQVILLRDGSAISGTVIKNTEYEVHIVAINGDTLDFSHKYVDRLITKEIYKELYLNQRVIPRHKTEGVFVNAEIVGYPFAISGGIRLNSNWNVGGTVYYGYLNHGNGFGIAPYVRYYIGNDLLHHRFFMDAYVGVSKRDYNSSFRRDNNDYPTTGGLGIGIQLPSLNGVRFYFKIGGFFSYNKQEFITRIFNGPDVLSTQNTIDPIIQASLIAIQF